MSSLIFFRQPLLASAALAFVKKFGHLCLAIGIEKYQFVVVAKRSHLKIIAQLLKYHWYLRCRQLTELTAVDYPTALFRFQVVYQFLSVFYAVRFRMVVATNELLGLETFSSIFLGSNWQEREVWDMYGIFFLGHPDLRRILTDYGFYGFPLRKDFPLSGFYELWFNEMRKRLGYQRISFAQEFRVFGFSPVWSKALGGTALPV